MEKKENFYFNRNTALLPVECKLGEYEEHDRAYYNFKASKSGNRRL